MPAMKGRGRPGGGRRARPACPPHWSTEGESPGQGLHDVLERGGGEEAGQADEVNESGREGLPEAARVPEVVQEAASRRPVPTTERWREGEQEVGALRCRPCPMALAINSGIPPLCSSRSRRRSPAHIDGAEGQVLRGTLRAEVRGGEGDGHELR